jgi:hypothetical protein
LSTRWPKPASSCQKACFYSKIDAFGAGRAPPICYHSRQSLKELKRTVSASTTTEDEAQPFDEAFSRAVDLGNQIADADEKADLWDVADGLLAGAVQYWLYTRQPCGDPRCEDCLAISTANARMAELRHLVEQFSEESQYFHSPTDSNVGRA